MGQKILVIGDSGSGKAQPLDADILTPTGFVKNRDLQIGDDICGDDGKVYNVKDIMPQGEIEAYEIVFNDGSRTLCNTEHLWTVLVNNHNKWVEKTYTTLELDDMINKDLPRPIKIKMPDPVSFNSTGYKFIPSYLLGVLIADGYLCGTITSFSTSEKYIVDKVSGLVDSGYSVNKQTGENYSYTIKSKDRTINDYTREIKRLGLNVHSYDKFIPKQYLLDTTENRLSLLQGLFDCDGCARGVRCSYSTTSKQLKDDVIFLCLSLGYKPTVSEDRRDRYTSGVCYSINIKIDKDLPIPFTNPKHLDRHIFSERYKKAYRYIKEVFKVDEKMEMQCISTTNPSGLYITDDFIVTHNSTSTRNLDPKTTFYINVIGKPLPFKGWKGQYKALNDEKKGNLYATHKADAILKVIKWIDSDRPEIKTIIIDDAQYIMSFEFMERAKEKGFDKFVEIGKNMFDVLTAPDKTRDDLTTIFLSHSEDVSANGYSKTKMKTIGKMLDDKITIEGLFTIVLLAYAQKKDKVMEYIFVTQSNGTTTAKSPMDMFKDITIPNDLKEVLGSIKKYEEG